MSIPENISAEIVGTSLGRKTEQVIAGARAVFMAQGFEGASVDDIARAAQVSKATLYAYFPDKSALFARVIREECALQEAIFGALIAEDRPTEELLGIMAERYITFLLSPFAQEVFRVCVGEARRFPDLAREFYGSGPGRAYGFLAEYFERADQRGCLKVENPMIAADQFTGLCRCGIFYRHVFGVETEASDAEVAQISAEAVKTFLARYRV